jgi:hypothetical protein
MSCTWRFHGKMGDVIEMIIWVSTQLNAYDARSLTCRDMPPIRRTMPN